MTKINQFKFSHSISLEERISNWVFYCIRCSFIQTSTWILILGSSSQTSTWISDSIFLFSYGILLLLPVIRILPGKQATSSFKSPLEAPTWISWHWVRSWDSYLDLLTMAPLMSLLLRSPDTGFPPETPTLIFWHWIPSWDSNLDLWHWLPSWGCYLDLLTLAPLILVLPPDTGSLPEAPTWTL